MIVKNDRRELFTVNFICR